jgi:diadenosine tetraphosphatase ApaH/serine/threonine PP2A family protein phosphatase
VPTTAIISDVHGNLEALEAVLGDIKSRGVERVICLGDIIGYGANPCECVDLVRANCQWSLMGNHDFGVLYEPTNFNPAAESSAYWTRDRLDQEPDDQKRRERYEFLGRLKVRVVETCPDGRTPLLAVHGSPRRPINEYIFPDDVASSPDKLETIFERVPKVCVVGHTHVPGVFTDEPDFYPPGELTDQTYLFNDREKAIINVGSVGQPRDLDPRASYVLLHDRGITFVRVAYDVEKAAERIRTTPALVDWLADRLLEGR